MSMIRTAAVMTAYSLTFVMQAAMPVLCVPFFAPLFEFEAYRLFIIVRNFFE